MVRIAVSCPRDPLALPAEAEPEDELVKSYREAQKGNRIASIVNLVAALVQLPTLYLTGSLLNLFTAVCFFLTAMGFAFSVRHWARAIEARKQEIATKKETRLLLASV